MSARVLRTAPAAAGALALVLGGLAPASAATDGGAPQVVNRETVQVELDSDGSLDVARLFSQLTVVGKGKVTVADPVSTKGLRNLDGFSKPSVEDGKAVYSFDVDGTETRRTVSDFDKALPVSVHVAYALNGKRVRAEDLVGKTGDVDVVYTIKNVTGTPTDITWRDGKGVSHTEQVSLVTPYVGQLSTTMPKSWTRIDAPRADGAGDGRGGTLLTWTMVLFEPIGEITQTFGFKAHVEDAVVPPASIQVVPVPPSRKPELKFGEDGFKDGAAAATALTGGAGLIDANLLKLQTGASDLLAGLTKLAAGAAQLRDGLQGEAAPGAKDLAAGAGEAKAGSAKLSSGLGDLADGASALSDGLGAAASGSGDLADGLALISGGLGELAAADGLPAAKAGALALRSAVDAIVAGLGAADQPGTVLNGLAQVAGGLTTVKAGLDALASNSTGLPAAKGGVDLVKAGLDDALVTGGSLDQLIAAAGALAPALVPSLEQLKTDTATASAALGQVSTGLASAVAGVGQLQAGVGDTATTGTIRNGVALVQGGLGQIAVGLKSGNPASPGVREGLDSLVAGLTAAVSGVLALDAGAREAAAGANDLDSGLGLLAAGGEQLSAGADEAAAGGTALDDGLGQIADGAGRLAEGLDDAASGSGQLADGLDQAKAGNSQLVDGTGRLRSEGTAALVAGGNLTASDAAEHYAVLVALGEKAQDGALPYGAPEGATGSAAYEFTLAGADTSSRDNTRRAVVALLGFVAAGAVSWVLRKRLALG